MSPDRFPPMHCLLTFETLARLRSTARAAEALCVTQSAVMHRIRQLEGWLGCAVFGRNDFSLTTEGAEYLAHVRGALSALQQVPLPRSPAGRQRLRVAVTPTFCREMLMPQLPAFQRLHPEIELTLQVSIPLLDVTAERSDLEIRFGRGGYADVEHCCLHTDHVTPACSPVVRARLVEMGELEEPTPARLLGSACAPLLRSPLEPWTTWFHQWDLSLQEPYVGAQFNDIGLLYDAAAADFGITLVRLGLGARWLAEGRLLRLSERVVPSPHGHYLCWEPGTLTRPAPRVFAEWLVAAMAGSQQPATPALGGS